MVLVTKKETETAVVGGVANNSPAPALTALSIFGNGGFTRDRLSEIATALSCPRMLLGGCLLKLYAISTQINSLRCWKITWQSIYADFHWKFILLMGPMWSVQGQISFFHNPRLCRGCAVVTSAFKTLTCVTGCAYVHTAQTINNNSNCCNSTRVYWVTQRRAKVTREAFIKTSVTQSLYALQRSQDLGAFVTGQPLEDYTEKIWHAARECQCCAHSGQQQLCLS